MSIEWLLYLIDVSGSLKQSFGVTLVCLIMVLTISTIIYLHNDLTNKGYNDYEDIKIRCQYFYKILIPILLISIAICIFIPSQKTMYAIALSHYSKQSEIPEKVLKAIEVKLDEVIEGSSK